MRDRCDIGDVCRIPYGLCGDNSKFSSGTSHNFFLRQGQEKAGGPKGGGVRSVRTMLSYTPYPRFLLSSLPESFAQLSLHEKICKKEKRKRAGQIMHWGKFVSHHELRILPENV